MRYLITLVTAFVLSVAALSTAHAQTTTTTPSPTVSVTPTPTTGATVPSGAPNTGHAVN